MRAILLHTNVRDELIGRIPKPHGLDITSNDVDLFMPLSEVKMFDGGFKSIREGLHKNIVKIIVLHTVILTILPLNVSMYCLMQVIVSFNSLQPPQMTRNSKVVIRYILIY